MNRNRITFWAFALVVFIQLTGAAWAEALDVVQLRDRLGPMARAGVAARPAPAAGPGPEVIAGRGTAIIFYDDGEPDNGFGPDTGFFFDAAMRFDLPRPGMDVDEVSVCFQRLGTDDSLDFDLTFWAADGPGGAPGTLVDFIPATANGVPDGLGGAFFTFDLMGQGVTLPDDTAYLGAGWDGDDEDGFFLCSDRDGAMVQPGFVDIDFSGNWESLVNADPDYTALMIRGQFSDDFVSGPCVPGPKTLCLNDDRFRAEIDFAAPGQPTAQGDAIEIDADDGGLFWFFSPENPEMLVKVIDACSLPGFNSFWVFYAATTNVEFTLTVTDTEAGATRIYPNPQGLAAPPIQDTSAFATCP